MWFLKIWGRSERAVNTWKPCRQERNPLVPKRKAINPNGGEEGEGILRLFKQSAGSADYLSHSLFSFVCFRSQRDRNWGSQNHFTVDHWMLIPWENTIKNRNSTITYLRTFCRDLKVGGQMSFLKFKLLNPHYHFLYHWFLNSASIYQASVGCQMTLDAEFTYPPGSEAFASRLLLSRYTCRQTS